MFGALADLAAKFKRDHLDTRRPPLIDGSDAAADYVRRRWADAHRRDAAVDAGGAGALRHRAHARIDGEDGRRAQGGARNQLKALIGEAAGIEGIATWKRCKDTVKAMVDWEAARAKSQASWPPSARRSRATVDRLHRRRSTPARS
jgi:predicted phage-related endonuclease